MIEFTSKEEPIHHITVEHGSNTYHFWYFLSDRESKPFDPVNDKKLVEQLHSEGVNQKVGTSTVLKSVKGYEYRSSKLDSANFAIQSLSCA